MTPRKIWGVIIVVLGVLAAINGASTCYEAKFYGNEIQQMGQQLSKSGYDKFFDARLYNLLIAGDVKHIEQQKTYGVMGAILGIAMCVGGTLLLRQKSRPRPRPRNRNFDEKECRF